MHSAFYLLAALWGGVCWRARGGGMTDCTGINPGTGGMRAIAAVAMVAPLLRANWLAALLMPALWIGWSTSGWAAFMGMADDTVADRAKAKNWLARILSPLPSPAFNTIGMAIEGMICVLPAAIAIFAVHRTFWLAAAVLLSGVMFTPAYWVVKATPWVPNCGCFIPSRSRTAWGETLVGAWVLSVLLWAVLS